jgi:CheY-like chemotaxis protein
MPRILVINDSPDNVEFFNDLLGGEGYDVVSVLRPLTDVGEVEALQPNIVVLDWLFGREAVGKEMMTMLANHPPTATIPIIVCTAANHFSEEEENVFKAQGVQIVYKPFEIQDLLSAVQRALQ